MTKKARKSNLSKNKVRVQSRNFANDIDNQNKVLSNGCGYDGHKNFSGDVSIKSKGKDALKTGTKANKQTGNEHNEIDNNDTGLFPPYMQWILFLFTLVFRLWYVGQKTNWWILHPDEIFQSLEVAHSEIHGYGFRPYEYLPPPDIESKNTTLARQLEYELGMYSLRSFLFPKIFAYVGHLTISAGYSGGLFVIWKYFHVSVTSFLTVAVYLFAKSISGSHDVAVISSILTTSSMYLNVLGTHTIVNSFTSPFVFFVMYYIIEKTSNLTGIMKKQQNLDSSVLAEDKTYDTNSIVPNCTDECYMETAWEQNKLNLDHNGNVKNVELVSKHVDQRVLQNCKTYSQLFSETFSKTLVNDVTTCMVGFIFGMLIYIRPDTIQVILITIVLFCRPKWDKFRFYISFICGTAIGICICVREDILSYGSYILSPWQWVKFNIIGSSTRLFGLQPTLFYLKSIFLEDALIQSLSIIFCIFILVYNLKIKASLRTKAINKLCLEVGVMLLLYSLKGHKEMRFTHDVIPLLFVIFSEMIIILCKCISVKYQSKLLLYSSLVCLMASQLRLFTSLDSRNLLKWTYNGIVNTSHVNICLDFISNQNNVTGVFLDSSIHMTGGYTILRQDVPIIALSHEEFLQFGKDSRVEIESFVFNSRPLSIHTFSHFADFISVQNTDYLLKVLVSDPTFNYLVLDADRKVNVGYAEVFRSGNMRVLKRTFDIRSERALHSLVSKIKYGRDLHLINTEADWLIYYGAYDKAKNRLKFVLETDKTNLEANQLLIQLYHIIGENRLARKVLRNCTNYHVREKCLQPNHHNK